MPTNVHRSPQVAGKTRVSEIIIAWISTEKLIQFFLE